MILKALLISAVLSAADGEKPRLSPKLTKSLDAVSNAYYRGDSIAVWKTLAPVARKFLQAARQYSLDRLSKTQLAEMNAWDNYFKKIQLTLLYCLSRKVGKERRVTTQSEKSFRGSALAKSLARDNLGTDTRDRSIFNTTSPPSLPKLADYLILIDPTLATCPCR